LTAINGEIFLVEQSSPSALITPVRTGAPLAFGISKTGPPESPLGERKIYF